MRFTTAMAIASSLVLIAATGPARAEKNVKPAAIKRLGQRVTQEIWNEGRLDRLGEIYAQDVVRHVPEHPDPIVGLEANKQYIAVTRAAFPDLHISLERQIVEGEWVALRWTMAGTHTADLPGLPATGKPMRVSGNSIARIVSGKYAEIWDEWNEHRLLQQLGAVPQPAK